MLTSTGLELRQAESTDWPHIVSLLTEADLPLEGAEEHLADFIVAEKAGQLVGAAALEGYGSTALLRSVVVHFQERGTGLGQRLVYNALEQAKASGFESVVLLTTSAASFFPRFGFKQIRREAAPLEVQSSVEFREACPLSATVMRLDLRKQPGRNEGSSLEVRLANEEDLPAITRIYNEGIEDQATLETELRTVEERRQWLHARGERHPVLVAVREDKVVGWASLNPFSPRQAYRFVADLSVYVDRKERGKGIGSVLLAALIEQARTLGYHKLVLTSFAHAIASNRLYVKCGFRHVGDYREQGQLNGQWVDTRLMELILE
ncbi:MAG TPA: arsinothricin resistance N-acetyltransferase ArsN1 family A [Chloroflexia bacterium]|nr:arsinothricin resistance N-acetyltransferase ArsN1 family A [Chloroflexia bacterium]